MCAVFGIWDHNIHVYIYIYIKTYAGAYSAFATAGARPGEHIFHAGS